MQFGQDELIPESRVNGGNSRCTQQVEFTLAKKIEVKIAIIPAGVSIGLILNQQPPFLRLVSSTEREI